MVTVIAKFADVFNCDDYVSCDVCSFSALPTVLRR